MQSNVYVRIYTAKISELAGEESLGKLILDLPSFRKEKLEKIKSLQGKYESATAFSLLVKGIKELAEVDASLKKVVEQSQIENNPDLVWDYLHYTTDEYGKPFFSGRRDIYFSLSHTKGCVACVVALTPVGCDVERIRPEAEHKKIAKRFFDSSEVEFLDSLIATGEYEKEFTKIWTKKESFVKLTGRGMGQDFASFDVFEIEQKEGLRYETSLLNGEDGTQYVLSICLKIK